MAYRCEICEKNRNMAHIVSHSNIKTRKQQRPNLRSVRAMVDGHAKRMRVCARCLRTPGLVTKAA